MENDSPSKQALREQLRELALRRSPGLRELPPDDASWAWLEVAVDQIQLMNAALSPYEDEFLQTVERLRHLGYGRMIQLIYGQWEKSQPGISRGQWP
jgi:hypothetical protein